MTEFFTGVAALFILSFIVIAPSLLRKQELTVSDRDEQNMVIARERLAELEKEHAEGRLTQEEFEATKSELETALWIDLDAKEVEVQQTRQGNFGIYTFISLLIVIPALAGGVYAQLGKPDMIDITPEKLAEVRKEREKSGDITMEQAIAKLEQKLQENPDNAEGWYMLGRTMMAVKKYDKAVYAYENAHKLLGDNVQVMLSLADAEAMTQNGDMSGRPKRLVYQALSMDSENVTANWLAALIEEKEGKVKEALQRLSKLYLSLKDIPEEQAEVAKLIKHMSDKHNVKPDAQVAAVELTQPATETNSQPADTQASITVNVSLSDELKDKASPNDLVFIYAKAVQGPRFPLAAERISVKDLPITVVLDDTKAMMPMAKLSSFKQVTVGARVSKSGQPIAQSGDLSAEISPVDSFNNETVDISINKILP